MTQDYLYYKDDVTYQKYYRHELTFLKSEFCGLVDLVYHKKNIDLESNSHKYIEIKFDLQQKLAEYGYQWYFEFNTLNDIIEDISRISPDYYPICLIKKLELEKVCDLILNSNSLWVWDSVLPEIKNAIQPKFVANQYNDVVTYLGDLVEKSIQRMVWRETGKELNNTDLITEAFCYDKNIPESLPAIPINFLSSNNEIIEQEAYKNLFLGFIQSSNKDVLSTVNHKFGIQRDECIGVILLADRLLRVLESRVIPEAIIARRILSKYPSGVINDYYSLKDEIMNVGGHERRTLIDEKFSNSQIFFSLNNKIFCIIKLFKKNIKIYLNISSNQIEHNNYPISETTSLPNNIFGNIEILYNQANKNEILDYIRQSFDVNTELHTGNKNSYLDNKILEIIKLHYNDDRFRTEWQELFNTDVTNSKNIILSKGFISFCNQYKDNISSVTKFYAVTKFVHPIQEVISILETMFPEGY